jgi:lipoprotein-anchoring transpeptidase ErfK/SrfK
MDGLTRRDFLKFCAAGIGTLTLEPFPKLLPPEGIEKPIGKGRVTVFSIGVYAEPDRESDKVRELHRDDIISLYETIQSPQGPPHNPRWYRVIGGYAHSAYIQRIENAHLNTPESYIPRVGRLGEITVPYTQSLRLTGKSWESVYRLYYQSIHWVVGVEAGQDGEPWYRLRDELLRLDYSVPAAHVRIINPAEFNPISPDVPAHLKRIEVSLIDQRLVAYENNQVVLETKISSGMPNLGPVRGIPTDTPRGSFRIDPKVPSKHMGDGLLTNDPEAYELPGVPWVCFFEHSTGVALHGTYWHDNFGARMSHGCVNLRMEDAKWIYRWTTPTANQRDWVRSGRGTQVNVY